MADLAKLAKRLISLDERIKDTTAVLKPIRQEVKDLKEQLCSGLQAKGCKVIKFPRKKKVLRICTSKRKAPVKKETAMARLESTDEYRHHAQSIVDLIWEGREVSEVEALRIEKVRDYSKRKRASGAEVEEGEEVVDGDDASVAPAKRSRRVSGASAADAGQDEV